MKIAVASGKGGTGKTTVAVNLACLMAESSDHICYVDCDVEEPNGHLFLKPSITRQWTVSIPFPSVDDRLCDGCGKCKEICQQNAITVINGKVLVFPELCNGCGGCSLVCPQEAIREIPKEIGNAMTGHAGELGFISGRLNVGEPMAVPVIRDVKKAITDNVEAIIDAPPGTTCPMIEAVRQVDYVLLVTEPTPFGLNDLKIAVDTMSKLDLPHAVIINRAGSGDESVKDFCLDRNIPVVTEIPDDRRVAELYSQGKIIYKSLPRFKEYFEDILRAINDKRKEREGNFMKIAIPVADGKLCAHFGHCQKFAIIEVDTDSRKIISKTDAEPPPHEPGILPQWLSEQGVNLIIAGGMGQRAQQFFNQYNIEVITGVTDVTSAEEVTMNYLNHTLQAGDNICDH